MIRDLLVGVSDARVSRGSDVCLVTYSLSSCVGVAIHDPVERIGGLLHFMLPDSRIDPVKATGNPWMFADTAIPLLLQWACRMGAKKTRLKVMVAGGAQILSARDSLEVGRKNLVAMHGVLRQLRLVPHEEDTGGFVVRTLRLEIGSGRLMVQREQIADKQRR
jgi:chemotaxis protein CheD